MAALIFLAALAAVVGFAVLLHAWRGSTARQLRATRTELRRHKAFLERVRATAYDHLELDSPLAAVLVDDLRKFNANTPLDLL